VPQRSPDEHRRQIQRKKPTYFWWWHSRVCISVQRAGGWFWRDFSPALSVIALSTGHSASLLFRFILYVQNFMYRSRRLSYRVIIFLSRSISPYAGANSYAYHRRIGNSAYCCARRGWWSIISVCMGSIATRPCRSATGRPQAPEAARHDAPAADAGPAVKRAVDAGLHV
jgi:hypothetical protein